MKRKKHIRLPNGYGSIRFIGEGRNLPYAVHPPAVRKEGRYTRPAPICYVPDWYTGFAVLSAYHSGTYTPGMEIDIKYDDADIDTFCQKVLAHAVYQADNGVSLEQAYKYMMEAKFGPHAPKKLSEGTRYVYQSGWNYLSPLAKRPIKSIKVDEIQNLINSCDKKQATKEIIKLVAQQTFKYAMSREYCDKDIGRYLVIPSGGEDEHGVPLTDDEIRALWKDSGSIYARLALIMCYSGFRISALETLEVNTEELYFKGGVKTKASKNRIVPIHSCIRCLVPYTLPPNYKNKLNAYLKKMNHTAHDCRHTFSMLCERYGVNEADRKRLMGHSFGSDITNGVYGHRTLEELRNEIEKIVGICVQ